MSEDLTGKRFGQLTVLESAGFHVTPSGTKRPLWKCRCDCGAEKVVQAKNLKNGTTVSCGCYKTKKLVESNYKHGGSKRGEYDKLYDVWRSMKRRCNNPNNKSYGYYGGTGISICDEWENNYSAFKEWAYQNGYDDTADRMKCTIDRIDPNGDYEPSNCRWVDMYVQNEDSHKRRFQCI